MSDQIQPGVMRCAKCNLRMLHSSLNAQTGSITANSDPVRCPNDCGPMWHVTWKQEAIEAQAEAVKAFDKIADLERQLAAARKDTERLEWVLPVVTGSNDAEADSRTVLLAQALFRGQDGRAAIDAARQQEGGGA